MVIKEIGRFGRARKVSSGQWETPGRRRGKGVRYERVGERGTERSGARCSRPSIAQSREIVKKNLLLVRYSFERLASHSNAESCKEDGVER